MTWALECEPDVMENELPLTWGKALKILGASWPPARPTLLTHWPQRLSTYLGHETASWLQLAIDHQCPQRGAFATRHPPWFRGARPS